MKETANILFFGFGFCDVKRFGEKTILLIPAVIASVGFIWRWGLDTSGKGK